MKISLTAVPAGGVSRAVGPGKQFLVTTAVGQWPPVAVAQSAQCLLNHISAKRDLEISCRRTPHRAILLWTSLGHLWQPQASPNLLSACEAHLCLRSDGGLSPSPKNTRNRFVDVPVRSSCRPKCCSLLAATAKRRALADSWSLPAGRETRR